MSDEPWERIDLAPKTSTKVAVFCVANRKYAEISKLTLPNFQAYCKSHGYFLRFYADGFHEDPARPETYGDKCKHEFYFDLRGHFDVVMYLDIDSLFVNMGVRVEHLIATLFRPSTRVADAFGNLARGPEKAFLWTYGEGGPQSGLWIARTDDTTEKHIRYAYEYAASENNVRHGKIEPNGISDQDAMTRLMNVPPFSATFGNCVPMESIGLHYTDTKEANPWVVTSRGGSVQDKLLGLNEWSERICNRT